MKKKTLCMSLQSRSAHGETPAETLSGTEERSRRADGSMTAEAALSVSLFVFFTAAVLGLFPMLQKDIETRYTLQKTCELLAYGAEPEGADEGQSAEREEKDEDVVLRLDPMEQLRFLPGAGRLFHMTDSVTMRRWTGRYLPEPSGTDGEPEDEYVIVCEDGSVYHTDGACSHLKLTVISVSMSQVSRERNKAGEIYRPCEKCGGACGDVVYITPEGNRYHSTENCSGLKRDYTLVKKDEVTLRPCSDCAAGP